MFDFNSFSHEANMTIFVMSAVFFVYGIVAGKIFDKIKDK